MQQSLCPNGLLPTNFPSNAGVWFILLLIFAPIYGGSKPPKWFDLSHMTFRPGDVVLLQKRNSLSIAVDWRTLKGIIRTKKSSVGKVYTIELGDYQGDPLPGKLMTVDYAATGWDREKAVALINKLSGKMLPLSCSCGAKHYMRYVVYGQVHLPCFDGMCPLRRNLKSLSVEKIKRADFYLTNNRFRQKLRNEVNVDKDLKPLVYG